MKSSALTLFFELAGPLEDRNRIGSPVHKSAQHSEDCGEHTPEGDVSQHYCRYWCQPTIEMSPLLRH